MGNRKGKKGDSENGLRAKALASLEPSPAAFEAFTAEARALDSRDVVHVKGDLERAFLNARLGVAAVFSHETDFRADLPRIDADALRSLPELARAVAFAAKTAKRAKGASAAEELRDRLWTLLQQRHDRLWRVGAYLFGRKKADKRVPPLDSRVKKKSKRI
jgi:hypothetical protein